MRGAWPNGIGSSEEKVLFSGILLSVWRDAFAAAGYLSSNPSTTGSNCFLRETTPGASRVPSGRGG